MVIELDLVNCVSLHERSQCLHALNFMTNEENSYLKNIFTVIENTVFVQRTC